MLLLPSLGERFARLCGERAVKSRLLSDENDSSNGHSYVRGEKSTRAGLLPVRKLLAVSE